MAEYLEIDDSLISLVKNRNVFPIHWAFLIAQGFDLSTDWLMTGQVSGGRKGEVALNKLEEIVRKIEELFLANDLYLPPAKKAKLVTLIYKDLEQEDISDSEIETKVVDLVRFAS